MIHHLRNVFCSFCVWCWPRHCFSFLSQHVFCEVAEMPAGVVLLVSAFWQLMPLGCFGIGPPVGLGCKTCTPWGEHYLHTTCCNRHPGGKGKSFEEKSIGQSKIIQQWTLTRRCRPYLVHKSHGTESNNKKSRVKSQILYETVAKWMHPTYKIPMTNRKIDALSTDGR